MKPEDIVVGEWYYNPEYGMLRQVKEINIAEHKINIPAMSLLTNKAFEGVFGQDWFPL